MVLSSLTCAFGGALAFLRDKSGGSCRLASISEKCKEIAVSDQSTIEAPRYDTQVTRPDENFEYLLEEIDDASIKLLGEATHGTREFYHTRAEVSKRLITEKGFDAIARGGTLPRTGRSGSGEAGTRAL
jgi:hypothetical protein